MIRIFLIVLTFIPFTANAAGGGIDVRINSPIKVNGSDPSVAQIIATFVDWIIQLGVVAATLAFVFTGFQYVAARGNPEALDRAKRSFLWTAIGTLVLIGAKVLTEIIKNTLLNAGVVSP